MTDRRRFRMGFRARVLGFLTALLVTATVVGFTLQRAVLYQRLDREVSESLDQERRELENLAAGRDPATGAPFAGDVQAIFETFLNRNVPIEGEVYLTFVGGQPHRYTPAPQGVRLDQDAALVERWARLTTGDRGELDSEAGPVEFLAVPLQSGGQTAGVFVVANFTRGERKEIDSGLRVEAGVASVVVLAAIAVTWLIAGRLLRPIRQLTVTARSITETDLSKRIPVEGHDEIAELSDTFNEMLDRLAAAFTSQRAFVDDAGHELRTPITIVRGHLELMGDDPMERQETIALVTDELDRMSRIVDDLLLLANAEQPDFVQLEPVEISDLTTELLVKSSALGERDWRLDQCADGSVLADPQRLSQAVLNLARNAVEHTAPGSEIGLGSSCVVGVVRMWVRDRGSGIEPAERDRIFERFARAGKGPRRSDGAGLGLAITQAVAIGHAGRVELDSRPGAGATFTLVFPAGAGHAIGGESPSMGASASLDRTTEVAVTQELEAAAADEPTPGIDTTERGA